MVNQTGTAITIRAFLPAGKSIDEQINNLTLVKTAHETGSYSALLEAAKIDEVKTEQKTRRVPETQDVKEPTATEKQATVETTSTEEVETPDEAPAKKPAAKPEKKRLR